MIIVDNRQKYKITTLDKLATGDIFEYARGDKYELFMKTTVQTTLGGASLVEVINMKNGNVDYFSYDLQVKLVSGSIVLEGTP